MCMWVLDIARFFLRELRPFKLSHFRQFFLHSRVWRLCYLLVLQFSMDIFETLHTCCGHKGRCVCGFLMALELIFKGNYGLLNLVVSAAFCTIGFGVCLINSFNSFQRMFLKLCRHIVDILKMCMWVLY